MKISPSYEDKMLGPKTIALHHRTELRSHTFKLVHGSADRVTKWLTQSQSFISKQNLPSDMSYEDRYRLSSNLDSGPIESAASTVRNIARKYPSRCRGCLYYISPSNVGRDREATKTSRETTSKKQKRQKLETNPVPTVATHFGKEASCSFLQCSASFDLLTDISELDED